MTYETNGRNPILQAFIRGELPALHLICTGEPRTGEEMDRIKSYLLENPAHLASLARQSPELLEDLFPQIFDGAYIPKRATVEESFPTCTQIDSPSWKLRHFLGTPGARELLRRTKRVITGFFASLDDQEAAIPAIDSLELINKLHGEKLRKTGEPMVCHESWMVARYLPEVAKVVHGASFSSPRDNELISSLLAALILHDIGEEYIRKGRATLHQYGSIISCLGQTDTTRPIGIIRCKSDEQVKLISTLVDLYTNTEYAREIITPWEETLINLRRIYLEIDDKPTFFKWAFWKGKLIDRLHNLMTLDKASMAKYLEKLTETMEYFAQWDFYTWTYPPKRLPLVAPDTLMLLLGASYDDLYGWIDNSPTITHKFSELEDSGNNPLLIPSIDEAWILTDNGQVYVFNRHNPMVFREISMKPEVARIR